MPKTVAEAVDRLVAGLSEHDKALIRGLPKEDMIQFHHSSGLGIRNRYGLWGDNEALLSTLPPEVRWGDNASMFILFAVWERLHASTGSGERE
jgi:hypothetical protein